MAHRSRVEFALTQVGQDGLQAYWESTAQAARSSVIEGTSRNDELIGTRRSDIIRGLAGDDDIFGLQHDDVIEGGEGDDHIVGGSGTNTVHGGDGNDDISSSGGDFLYGDAGNDHLRVSARDRAFGGIGNDEFLIGDKDSVIDGGAGTDAVRFNGKYKNFVASYEEDGLLIGTTKAPHGSPKPQVLMDETIEQIKWGGLTIDRRHLAAPEISYLYDDVGQVFDDGTATGHVQQIAGIADPFARITISWGEDVVGVCTARSDGSWTLHIDTDPFEGSVELVARADYGMAKTQDSEEFNFEIASNADASSASGFHLV